MPIAVNAKKRVRALLVGVAGLAVLAVGGLRREFGPRRRIR